jgi:hypothetical protein
MDNKEKLIIRQSSLNRTIELYSNMGLEPTMLELLATSEHLVQYVENGLTKEIIEKTKGVDKFIKDKKNG